MDNFFLNKVKNSEIRENGESSASGKYSPIFNWSPLPPRKLFNYNTTDTIPSVSTEEFKHYPNCDQTVWLRSCEKEIAEPINGVVTGAIPEWLNGSLIRNGPGSLKVGDDYFKHLFDSSALLHRFNINNGKVTYQCKFVQSETYKRNWKANRIICTEFGTKAVPDPCATIFQKVSSIFNPRPYLSDNSMISVYPFGDEIYAFNETPVIHKINPVTLETEGRIHVDDFVSIVHHTSHPHVMNDGTVYNLGMTLYPTGPHHSIICFPPDTKGEEAAMFKNAHIVGSIPARWPLHPSYMHTFGVTENYFVIIEQPLNLSLTRTVTSKLRNEPLASCFKWFHDEKTQINLLGRETGELKYKFFSEAFFYLHIINAYEVSDYMVIDICSYRDPSMLDCMYIETMKVMQTNPDYAKMFRGRPIRFVLPLQPEPANQSMDHNLVKLPNTKAQAYYINNNIFVKPEILCNLGCETPRIFYEKYLGKKYRFFYAISSDVDRENPGTIIKVDIENRTTKTWCESNCYPSEPVFIPYPHGTNEDDGIILASMVWGNEDTNHTGLLVLDAKLFVELGRVEFVTPSPVPKCLHGWFISNKGAD